MQNLFDQLAPCPAELSLLATLCNTTMDHHGFKVALRQIPALPGKFTLGDAAAVYFQHMLAFVQQSQSHIALIAESRAPEGMSSGKYERPFGEKP